jgi:hypothetical protein
MRICWGIVYSDGEPDAVVFLIDREKDSRRCRTRDCKWWVLYLVYSMPWSLWLGFQSFGQQVVDTLC